MDAANPVQHGSEAVAYHIPTVPSAGDTSPLKTTIALPRRSAWTSGLHFHATHTEYLRLVKGAVFVELNGKTKLISALVGGEVDASTGQQIQEGLVIEIPRYARHNWGRLDHYISLTRQGRSPQPIWPEDWTEEVVVEESTDPSDISKPLFFWNLNGIITAPSDTIFCMRQRVAKGFLGDLWIDLQLFVVFWELDNWPIFIDFRKLPLGVRPSWALRMGEGAEIVTSFIVLCVARVFGILLGLRAVEQRRTPDALWEAYWKSARD
ncbi:hypothetical protein BU25DRAFT_432315 [Macroventuria anomochaeta]|uniref:Uncharacterized protein n=1 Tax=Macroventuria anomochaeta TaxID=301207 RepID=A0ACB6RVY1_9PLEO|nr:uncharacterized protein BU25DRAFT_432315 [Macroventuria anomochaeta]KAF2626130.1 hypothetical protein BU25DRAFT_432315 [Macroventuria anomochaeta]